MVDLTFRMIDRMAERVASSVSFSFPGQPEEVLPDHIDHAGLNIRVPFCAFRCTYCALPGERFSAKSADHFVSALNKEIELYAARYERAKIERIYLSGGTPSLLYESIGGIVDEVKKHFEFKGPVSMEASPVDLDDHVLDGLRSGGVNQLSIGIQTFNEEILSRYLNRKVTQADLIETLKRVRESKFDYINIDLMFSLPFQTKESLLHDLEIAVSTGVDGISTYPLMLLPYTPLASKILLNQNRAQKAHISSLHGFSQNPATEMDQYLLILSFLRQHGYQIRTIWSFSKAPEKYEGPYEHSNFIGMGPRAWGMLGNRFTLNMPSVLPYADAIAGGKFPIFAFSAVRDYPLARFARKLYHGKITVDEIEMINEQDQGIKRYLLMMKLLGLIKRKRDYYELTDKALAYGSCATKKIASATLIKINEVFASFDQPKTMTFSPTA
ncbi:MAG: radical SAM protein [Methanomassiliicoccales archaeon]|nr:radical SAM protein [Methanomassiliicoccales archaeon]